jgi:hypothetical protein
MATFSVWHALILLWMMVVSGYPLARLARRTGYSPALGWLAGTVGLFIAGPVLFIWWLSFAKWPAAQDAK